MTTKTTTPENATKKGRRPSHNIQRIVEDGKWPFIGAVWQNKDGSLNVVLDDDLPKGAKLHIRPRKARG